MSIIDFNEADLWTSFTDGNEEAFSLIYKKNYAKLYSYGVSLGLGDETVRDIVQELFVKLYTNPHLIKNTSTILSFLLVSVRNAAANHVKYRNRHVNYQQFDNFEFPYCIENNHLEDKEELSIIKAKVDAVLKSLTPRQKEIIYLRFLQQMEYDEIADIMNLTEQAARNLVYRAIEKARKSNLDLMLLLLLLALCSETIPD